MEVAELREWSRPATLAGERTLPVLPALAPVLPSGLRRGAIVGVSGPGATSVALCLLAGPSRAGSWTAVVGLPDLGVAAAAEAGMDLSRLALVPHPGDRGPTVAATLVDALDVVVLGPGAGVGPVDARRLAARARQRGAVLVVVGRPWPERCDIELSVVASGWVGLERGCGHLSRRLLEVAAGGRRGNQRRTTRMWMPFGEGAPLPWEPGPTTDGEDTEQNGETDGGRPAGPVQLVAG